MSFAVVLEGMTLIAYVVIVSGGKQKREGGWRVLSGLHLCCAALQCAGMAIVVSFPSLKSVALAGVFGDVGKGEGRESE